MDEWLEAADRLERTKRIRLRRQQRALKKEQLEREKEEKQRQRQQTRCSKMKEEDQLSVAMMRWYAAKEQERLQEDRHKEDLKVYENIFSSRKNAKRLGVSQSTPGLNGIARLHELNDRIAEVEVLHKCADQARTRLEVLPEKKRRIQALFQSFFKLSYDRKLEHAVYHQRCDAVLALVEQHIAPKSIDTSVLDYESENGFTPVLCAIFRRKLSLLRRFLTLGASVNMETKKTMTPLIAAICTDDIVAFDILQAFHVDLNAETRSGVRPLLLAATKGRCQMLLLILRAGVDVNQTNSDGRTALIQAVIAGEYEAAKILLAFDANIDVQGKDGRTAMDWARELHWNGLVALLTSNIPRSQLRQQVEDDDETERSAPIALAARRFNLKKRSAMLDSAMHQRDVGRILELISANDTAIGVNHESKDGDMPLLVLAKYGCANDVRECLNAHCIATLLNRRGITALMAAAKNANQDVLQLLLIAGCNPYVIDFDGKDAFRHLTDHDHLDVAQEVRRLTHETNRNLEQSRLSLGAPCIQQITLEKLSTSSTCDQCTSNEELPEKREISEDQLIEENLEDARIHQWSIRKRALHKNTKERIEFEQERAKICLCAQRGRRNCIIAPLPNDPAGRLKYPVCDACRKRRARKRCYQCAQVQCDPCHARLHERPQRMHHEYEELAPIVLVGNTPKEVVVATQENLLSGCLARSECCLTKIRECLVGCSDDAGSDANQVIDGEFIQYNIKKKRERERRVLLLQQNVPVAAARYAACHGEGEVYSTPTELELVDLYLTQQRFTAARDILTAVKNAVEEALGCSHPTMFRIYHRQAQVEQGLGNPDKACKMLQDALVTFESVISTESPDLVAVQNMLLDLLDLQGLRQQTVDFSRQLLRFRTMSLSSSHSLTHCAQKILDDSIAKHEKAQMEQEDELAAQQAANLAGIELRKKQESDLRLERFRHLLLEDPDHLDSFLAFAKTEYADDLVRFWIAVEQARSIEDTKAFRAAVRFIFITYIKSRRVKIVTAVQRKKLRKHITNPGRKLPPDVLDEVQTLVFGVLYNRIYPHFVDTAA